MSGLRPLRPPIGAAQNQDEDSGRGRGRGRGRGHGGDDHNDQEAESVPGIAATAPAGAIEVQIVSDDVGGFVPGELTVDAGQTVAFVNGHDDEHTATGSGFDTGIIPPGSIATVSLETPGVFFYACQIHPEMTGTIRVRDSSGNVPAPDPDIAEAPQGSVTISIENLSFVPASADVPLGTTVVWQNADAAPHTVTSTTGVFDSGIFDPGSSFEWTFEEPGSFPYACQLHPQMQGTIVVSDERANGSSADEAGTPVAQTGAATETGAVELPRGPWLMEFVPGEPGALGESRALMTFHQDGTLTADFVGGAENPGSLGKLGPGQGEWENRGGQVRIAVVILVLDEASNFDGLLFVEGNLALDTKGAALSGEVTVSGSTPAAELTSGSGILRGPLVPLAAGDLQ